MSDTLRERQDAELLSSLTRSARRTSARGVTAARSNALIAGASQSRRGALSRLFDTVAVTFGEVLQEPSTIRYVYFPVDCLISLSVPLASHPAVEVGLVGNEGMIGASIALGARGTSLQALVQGSGTALRLDADEFRRELDRNPQLEAGVRRYVHVLMGQLGQSGACNAFHPIEARCARWLLMIRDRLQSNELALTHELLARMLGVRRVGVTVAAGNLQRRGLIAYSRGKITILDGPRLAASACECYLVLQKLHSSVRA